YGRVQLVFHWDRESRHSAWVRVASHWAGGETGAVSHPRVGSEVVIAHLDGNPDHPLVIGVVYNAQRMPPWKLPEQKALTGLRSRELQGDAGNAPGGRSNHVLLDDTPSQLQLKLRSDTDASELTLGHNVRIDSTRGRTDQAG
ncbi:type VI secretion system tip protein VgrG, partial [Xanthomonas citri pv. citri]